MTNREFLKNRLQTKSLMFAKLRLKDTRKFNKYLIFKLFDFNKNHMHKKHHFSLSLFELLKFCFLSSSARLHLNSCLSLDSKVPRVRLRTSAIFLHLSMETWSGHKCVYTKSLRIGEIVVWNQFQRIVWPFSVDRAARQKPQVSI